MVSKDFDKCPQCGGLMHTSKEPNYKFNKCYACGYLYDSEAERKTKPKEQGAVCFVFEDGNSLNFSLVSGGFDNFHRVAIDFMNKNNKIDKEKCYITRWNDKLKETEIVYGKLPDCYRTYIEDDYFPYKIKK